MAIPVGFVYLAAALGAWSRPVSFASITPRDRCAIVAGDAISRLIDARFAVASLTAAIRSRAPPKDCIRHPDRGPQDASEPYREPLAA